MSEGINSISTMGAHRYSALSANEKRAVAVAAALDLIALNIQGANSGDLLEGELNKLRGYADKIQEALGTS
ncbi:hypothetical protein [Pseudomonas asplenii]|uniref:Uncharacterized protein n=1 Tax=Pseudomonas asplenii TaxID=53407 RepID=A0A1H6P9V0_9PSED|nr:MULTISPECIES: hypothetical protein [Pseudomonas]SEI23620.1 hypothetical protein SAMN05216581_5240 [Pseudomonas fuscovaginae]